MEHELPKHEKIRFRRDEITDLGTFPSASMPDPRSSRPWLPARAKKALLVGLAGFLGVALLCTIAIYAIGASGIGSERLRIAAERSLEEAAGVDIDASVGPARITFDVARFLALEVRDVSLKFASDGRSIADAGFVRFGIRLLPLLTGDIRLSSARLSNARISAPPMAAGEGTGWSASLRGKDGLISPDLVIDAVFAGAHRAFDMINGSKMRRVTLEDIDLVLSDYGAGVVHIESAVLSEKDAGKIQLSAEMGLAGRSLMLEGSAERDSTSGRITNLEVSANEAPGGASEATLQPESTRVGVIDVVLSGSEGSIGTPEFLRLALQLKNSGIDLGKHGVLVGDVDVHGRLVKGVEKIGIERLRTTVGRSVLEFQGLIEPRPADATSAEAPSYEYDFISARSTIAPAGSPEPALITSMRVHGTLSETDRRITAKEIIVKSGRGEVLGTASVDLIKGGAPGMSAAFSVHDMPASHVKQLWPWFSANKAREWVMQKLFGGRVVDGALQFQVVPGRLGNGVPLTGDEVFGTFSIERTRFDTAGLIPPVRDASGVVKFKGNDVEIALSSGTVYLPSGRTVAASNGELMIKKANVPPVIGLLDIDVAGDAPAVAELASYDPINAMRFVEFAADEFSGNVSGHVKAEIPLQRGIDPASLDWSVALEYADVAISKPVDGQMVTDASGTIVVDRKRAVITAKAKLSGVAAEIEAIESFGADAPPRKRTIKLSLDDKAREILVPGISNIVKGTVKVTLDSVPDGKQRVVADLSAAQLDIPWAGWSKGPGIAADASFILEGRDGASTISEFKLAGKTFGAEGFLELAGGGLSAAKFSSVRLNRDDDVAIAVKKSSAGYSVDIAGKAFDARSVIRQFTADKSTATKAVDSGSVSVHVDVGALTGFGGERLSAVTLDYRGKGNKVVALSVTANTQSGARVEVRNLVEGDSRSMRMQSDDAGAVLRFLDIYEHMEGGKISLSLAGSADGPMSGHVDAQNFFLVNEPRLGSMVSTRPPGGSRSLNEAVKRDIDTSRVQFQRGFTEINKGPGDLRLTNGVLRGPVIGATFQGTLYDKQGNMDMTGTFMPAYGLNRLFSEIPIVGILLGNGRDQGLIGVTFKLKGDADAPVVSINPLSAIAPGIFRSIFEYQ